MYGIAFLKVQHIVGNECEKFYGFITARLNEEMHFKWLSLVQVCFLLWHFLLSEL